MVTDEIGAKLHHRFVLGEDLTEAEKGQLNDWYARMDAEEAALLRKNYRGHVPTEEELEELRAKTRDAANLLEFLLGKIKSIEENNENLRKQNKILLEKVDLLLKRKAA